MKEFKEVQLSIDGRITSVSKSVRQDELANNRSFFATEIAGGAQQELQQIIVENRDEINCYRAVFYVPTELYSKLVLAGGNPKLIFDLLVEEFTTETSTQKTEEDFASAGI